MKNVKKAYMTPMVEVMNARVEKVLLVLVLLLVSRMTVLDVLLCPRLSSTSQTPTSTNQELLRRKRESFLIEGLFLYIYFSEYSLKPMPLIHLQYSTRSVYN